MSIATYVRNIWVNGGQPAISQNNLNNVETQVQALSDEFTTELVRPITTKATIVDADEVGGNNSGNSFKWVKWTWTVIKDYLKTYFDTLYPTITSVVPLPRTNLMSHHSGDGVPAYPDDSGGVTYLNNKNFTTADGWTAVNCTLSYSGGRMIVTATAANPAITRAVTASRMIEAIFRKISGSATASTISNTTGTVYTETKTYIPDDKKVHSFFIGAGATGNLSIILGSAGSAAGDVYEIETIYIGTGAFTSNLLDKNGNTDMLMSSVVPVNGKFGKALSFNGVTSYLRSLLYFTMPPIFFFHCRWSGIENLAIAQILIGQSAAFHPAIFRSPTSTILSVRYWDGSALQIVSFNNFFTAAEHSIDVVINRTAGTITAYKDGVLFEVKPGLTIALNTTSEYLYYGRRADGSYTKGQLEQIITANYAPTAAEVMRLHIDPRY